MKHNIRFFAFLFVVMICLGSHLEFYTASFFKPFYTWPIGFLGDFFSPSFLDDSVLVYFYDNHFYVLSGLGCFLFYTILYCLVFLLTTIERS